MPLKKIKKKDTKPNEIGSTSKTKVKCDQCRKTFPRTCDLEEHLKSQNITKEYSCKTCGKEFYLKWRLEKHVKVHSEQVQFCHFYNNGQICPYDEIGCIFRREESEQCRTRNCTRKLCPNKHEAVNDDCIEDVETDSDDEENFQADENQCHICFKQ